MSRERHWERVRDGLYKFVDSCNVYALETGDETTLVNAGTGAWLDAIDELPSLPTRIVLTHFFRDHSAGAALAARAGIEVWASYWERELLEDPLGHFSRRETYIIYDNGWDLFAPLEPIPVSRWLLDWETIDLPDATLTILPSPGQSNGAISISAESKAGRGIFAGEVIHSPGKIKRIAPLQYNYNDLPGAMNLLYSLDQYRRVSPEWIASSTGPELITGPSAAIDALEANLRFALSSRGIPETDLDSVTSDELVEITSHLYQSRLGGASTYFLISESGEALAIDYGYRMGVGSGGGYPFPRNRRPIMHGLEPLRKRFGIEAPEAVLVTHFHDDHVNGIPTLQRLYGTRCLASETFAPLLACPEAYAFPCTWPEPIDVTPLSNGQTHRWNEYEFSLHPMSGHTRFSTLIMLHVDGERVVASGDQYFFQDFGKPGTGPAAHNHVYRNGAELGSFRHSQETLERLDPTIILPGHGPAYRVPPSLLEWTGRYRDNYEEVHRRLMPLEENEIHFDVDSRAAWLEPYRVHIPSPRSVRYVAHVLNPIPRPATIRLRIVGPDGWTSDADEVYLDGRATGSVELTLEPPAEIICRRQPIGLELACGEHLFGVVAEALITIGHNVF